MHDKTSWTNTAAPPRGGGTRLLRGRGCSGEEAAQGKRLLSSASRRSDVKLFIKLFRPSAPAFRSGLPLRPSALIALKCDTNRFETIPTRDHSRLHCRACVLRWAARTTFSVWTCTSSTSTSRPRPRSIRSKRRVEPPDASCSPRTSPAAAVRHLQLLALPPCWPS